MQGIVAHTGPVEGHADLEIGTYPRSQGDAHTMPMPGRDLKELSNGSKVTPDAPCAGCDASTGVVKSNRTHRTQSEGEVELKLPRVLRA